MTEIEQELVLFFKLYFLAHTQNYINYMAQTKILAKWFDFSNAALIPIDQAPVYCGHCLNEVGRTIGGGFSLTCSTCKRGTNLAYEIGRLAEITGINWYLCMYLMVRAIEDIYKTNNVICFKAVIN